MANLDLSVVSITNPTSDDFSWRYNGELYSIKAGESMSFAKPVAYHLAHHLSTKMIEGEALKGVSPKRIADKNDPIHVEVSQLHIYDTHQKRIALYKILKDTQDVLKVMGHYSSKGFIGDMALYQSFVEKAEAKI